MSQLNTKIDFVVADYPAMSVVKRKVSKGAYIGDKFDSEIEFTDIVAWESLCFAYESRNHGRLYSQVKPGSVVSYAMKNNDCPLEAIERAVKNKHQLHWVNSCASVISASRFPQEVWTLIDNEQLVRFEGRLFIFIHNNDHARLVPFVK